jgi:predicted phosphodiesterase
VAVAALYDIHGNLPALEAVLAELEREGVNELVAGGDVLWGPFQSECIGLLRDAGARLLAGNCERDVLHGSSDRDRWCRAQLTESERAFVASWPATHAVRVEGLGDVVFCHATPRSDEEILTRATLDGAVAEALRDVTAHVVVCGHTHVQFDRRAPGAPRLVNAGSVGLAYELAPAAYWALLGPEVELRRTAYDVGAAQTRLLATGFPGVDEVFGAALRGEVSPEEATAHFESQRGA